MEKWLKRDIDLSEKLYKELIELDKERPNIEAKKKALDPEIKQAHKEFVYEAVCNNPTEAGAAKRKVLEGLDKKYNIGDAHYRKRTAVEVENQKIKQPYQIRSISDLNKLVHQILSQRKFEVKEKTTSSDKGLPFYVIQHNWVSIGKVVDVLMSTMDKIRDSDLSPLSEIKKIYEDAVKSIPDDFPLTDEAQGGELMLSRFREGMGEAHIQIETDSFMQMNMDQAKIIGEEGRLKQALFGLKKFFKNATA